jgi:hypothetical protein
MTREQMYQIYKDVLCRFGAIPPCENCYENLIMHLIDIYEKKPNELLSKTYHRHGK